MVCDIYGARFISPAICLIFCQVLFGVACSSDSRNDDTAPNADAWDSSQDALENINDSGDGSQVVQLILSPDPIEVIVSQTIQMSSRSYNASGVQLEDQVIIWHVENRQVAEIDESGLLRGVAAGETTLVAVNGDIEKSVEVSVLPIDTIERIEIVPERREIGVDEDILLGIKAYQSDGSEAANLSLPVEWQSDAPAIAAIDVEGNLMGLKPGEVTIRAQIDELVAEASFQVELKFGALECAAESCLALSMNGQLYFIGFNELEREVNRIWMPKIDLVDVDSDVRFKSFTSQGSRIDSNAFCGISLEGIAYCWGDNTLGNIGLDFEISHTEIPTAINSELRFESLDMGQHSTCGLTNNRELYCWGDILISGNWMSRGLDLYETHSAQPVLIDEGPFEELIMNGQSLYVQDQKTQKWYGMGRGESGELGNGEQVDQDHLVDVAAPGVFKRLASDYNFAGGAPTCGIDTQDQVWCWGRGRRSAFGQSMNANEFDLQDPPERTAWDTPIVDISALRQGFCGVTIEREIRCWGDNSHCKLGQHAPGYGLQDPRYQPQAPIEGLPEDWAHLTGRCVLTTGGDIWCWGLNRTTDDPVTPVRCEPTAQRVHTF